MQDLTSERLNKLGYKLPSIPPAAGNYVHCVRTGKFIYLSGGLSIGSDNSVEGIVGQDVSIEQAVEGAKLALLGRLAVLKDILNNLDKVEKIIKVEGYVASTADFHRHPEVINGASELLLKIFGTDRGSHSRIAVGVSALPLGAAVEISMIVQAQEE